MNSTPRAARTLRIGFAIDGISNLKILGPLLREAANFNIVPVALVGRHAGKSYDQLTPEMLQSAFPSISLRNFLYYDEYPFASLLDRADIEALVILNPYGKYVPHLSFLKKSGIATFGIDYFANSLYVASRRGFEQQIRTALPILSARFVTSKFWADLECQINSDSARYREKFITLGTPITDTWRHCTPAISRQLLEIPGNKKIVCLLTPNIRQVHLLSHYGLTTIYKLKKSLKTIQQFCHDAGYVLVIKHREKQWDTRMYRRFSDVFLADLPTAVYPSTTAHLLSNCEIMIHFGSMAVMEAAAAGVPSLGIGVEAIDKLHTYMTPLGRQLIKERVLSTERESLFNFHGVSQALPIVFSRVEMARLCRSLIEGRQENTASFQRFNSIYSGTGATPSATSILNFIANFCRQG